MEKHRNLSRTLFWFGGQTLLLIDEESERLLREGESAALGLISKPSKTESVCVCVCVCVCERESERERGEKN